MDGLIEILNVIAQFSPLAVIGLLGTVIFILVYRSPFKPIETKLDTISGNHLHPLPEIAEDMKKVVDILQRIEVKMGEDFAYLKAKMNNKG